MHSANFAGPDLAAHPHRQLRRRTREVVAEHPHSTETLCRALDDVLDPGQDEQRRALSVRHLADRVERERHVLDEAS